MIETITMRPIALIRTPYREPENMPIQPKGAKEVLATIEFQPEYVEGLKDLEGFSHCYLIYHFHKVRGPKLTVTPFVDKSQTPRGVFATRAPVHPNTIGLSVVKLIGVEGNIVTIQGADVLDGTPLLDIKPYIENFDKIEGEVRSGWMQASEEEISGHRSDERFTE